jgi:iron(III) transport system permease protein
MAGGILCFSFAMLEVSDSMILAMREQHYPMTKAIYSLFKYINGGPYLASAMGVIGMGVLATALLVASQALGKRMGELFR